LGCQLQATSAIDWLERLVPEMIYYVSSGTLRRVYTRQRFACISATCISLYTATDGQQSGNNFVAGNMLLVADSMLLQACCRQEATHVEGNMCKRGFKLYSLTNY